MWIPVYIERDPHFPALKGGFGSPGELKMTDRIRDINQG